MYQFIIKYHNLDISYQFIGRERIINKIKFWRQDFKCFAEILRFYARQNKKFDLRLVI